MYIFARFHVKAGEESAAEAALREVIPPSREEPGCVKLDGFRSTRDGRLFFIHSEWADEAAFDVHAQLPHTRRFLEKMGALADQPIEVARTKMMI